MTRFLRILLSLTLLGPLLAVYGCRGVATNSANNGTPASTLTTQSPVKTLIVVVMQNSSFDHLFGTFPGANGIKPGEPGFVQQDANGNSVSPSLLTTVTPPTLPEGRGIYLHDIDAGKMDKFAFYSGDIAMDYYDNTIPGIDRIWGLAQQYALADNYFHSSINEAPSNQLYMVAAFDNNQTFIVQPAFGPCQRSDPHAVPFTFPNVGDELTSAKVSWNWFQEQYGVCGNYVPTEDPFQYFTSTNASGAIKDFTAFEADLQTGSLPAVSFIAPAPGHDMHPGSGDVSVAASWLANLVQSVQNSPAWPDCAIIVTFDDGGGWYDHVPPPVVDSQGLGERVPMMVISPFAKRGYISHLQMDHVSILKFIQWNWNLPSLNARNSSQASGDIRDMFQF